MAANDTLYSRIRNISGAAKNCSWFPPHGKTFAIGESVTLFGNIYSYFQSPSRIMNRKRAAFELDVVTNNHIEITQSPAPLIFDATAQAVKVVTVSNGTLSAISPSYGAYAGSP